MTVKSRDLCAHFSLFRDGVGMAPATVANTAFFYLERGCGVPVRIRQLRAG